MWNTSLGNPQRETFEGERSDSVLERPQVKTKASSNVIQGFTIHVLDEDIVTLLLDVYGT